MTPLLPWFNQALDKLIYKNIYVEEDTLRVFQQRLVKGLSDYRDRYQIGKVALGISGGVDSALTAALFKEAGWQVLGVTMPIHQNPEETARGVEACQALGIEHRHLDLTEDFDRLYGSFLARDHSLVNSPLRSGNLRVRLRMMTVYNEASRIGGLVGSTDNFSELAAGFWTLHGDVGDLAPIQSLSKSWEVPKLAEMCGVPDPTVFARPTDGLGISNGDEDQFGFSYLEFDIVLLSLVSAVTRHDISRLDQLMPMLEIDPTDTETVQRVTQILNRIKSSTFKRANPYNLNHPLDPGRYQGLANLDLALRT
jgi:nicotinamide-nucleotide amidase